MGSSGKKKPKHQPKVGTKPERKYALKESQRDVAGNLGVHGKGVVYWVALILIGVMLLGGVVSLALWTI